MQQFILLFAFKRQNKLRDANLIGYLELLPLLPRPTIKHLIPGATLPIYGFIMLGEFYYAGSALNSPYSAR